MDRLRAYGWHFLLRCQAKGSLWFRDRCGWEGPLAQRLRQHRRAPGQRFKAQGWVYKKAGWGKVSVVAVWAVGEKEPMVVLTDLAPRWEESQVRELEHQQRLLLGMAWASLVALCLGVAEGEARRALLAQRRPRRGRMPKPQPARESIFTMGVRRARGWLYGSVTEASRWRLPQVDALSWTCQWYHDQSLRYIFKTVRP